MQQQHNATPSNEKHFHTDFSELARQLQGSESTPVVCVCHLTSCRDVLECQDAVTRYLLLQEQLPNTASCSCAMSQMQVLLLLHRVILKQPQIWPTSVDSDLIKQCRVNWWGQGKVVCSSYAGGEASSHLHQLERIMHQTTSHELSPELALLFLLLPQLPTVSEGSTYRTKYFTFLVVHWFVICCKHLETSWCQTATTCYKVSFQVEPLS